MEENRLFVVAGAGPSGSLAALNLAQRGYNVELLEKRDDFRGSDGSYAGRSINLALSARGRSALRRVGLEEEVMRNAIPMFGRYMHGQDGRCWFQPYGQPHEYILSVGREDVNRIILNAAEMTGKVHTRFGTQCNRVRFVTGEDGAICTEMSIQSDGKVEVLHPEAIIGADGAYSSVRSAIQRRKGTNFSQQYLDHGYKELSMPPNASGDYALRGDVLHIWPRGEFMLIALPNLDRTFTVTLFLPWSKGKYCFDNLKTSEQIVKFFADIFPDTIPLIPNLVEEFDNNPAGHLATLRVDPWNYANTVLVGDAAHAVVPFYGQGMNASLQDVEVLFDIIDKRNALQDKSPAGALEDAFEEYSRVHRADGNAVADLSYSNYVEMRDRVTSMAFLARKRVELVLNRLFPSRFIPLYSMVSFTTIPYHQVVERDERQRKVVDRVLYATPLIAGAVAAMIVAASFVPRLSNSVNPASIIAKL